MRQAMEFFLHMGSLLTDKREMLVDKVPIKIIQDF